MLDLVKKSWLKQTGNLKKGKKGDEEEQKEGGEDSNLD